MGPALHFNVEIRAREKKQLLRAIKKLTEGDISFTFKTEWNTPREYILTVHDMPWGANLEWLGRVLDKEDR